MQHIRKDFAFFGGTLLENPWNDQGIKGINILWLIPLLSWLTALASSIVSMHYTKMATSAEKQPGQGCSNVMLLVLMPLFSLYITFIVPAASAFTGSARISSPSFRPSWLNKIYNPAKIRAQAEVEYEERRKRRAEDKKRLAEARAREEEEARRQAAEEKKLLEEKKKAANAPKQPPASKNPNKRKRRENDESAASEEELPVNPQPEEEPAGESGPAGEAGTAENADEEK